MWRRPAALACGQATILIRLLLTGFYQMLLAHAVKDRAGRAEEIIMSIYKSLNSCNWTSTNITTPDRFNQLNKKCIFWSFVFFSKLRETSPAQTGMITILTNYFGLVRTYTVTSQLIKGALKQKNKDLSNQCLRSPRGILSRDSSLEWKDQNVWVVVPISLITSCHVASLDLTIQSLYPKKICQRSNPWYLWM